MGSEDAAGEPCPGIDIRGPRSHVSPLPQATFHRTGESRAEAHPAPTQRPAAHPHQLGNPGLGGAVSAFILLS